MLYFYGAHEFAVRVVFEVVVRLSPVKIPERACAFSRQNELIQVFLELGVFYCWCAELNVSFEIYLGWKMDTGQPVGKKSAKKQA